MEVDLRFNDIETSFANKLNFRRGHGKQGVPYLYSPMCRLTKAYL
jgi:hypothetical protein